MIYLTTIKRQILILMRDALGEHLTTGDIAEKLDEPIFRVRAELRDLRRYRLAREDISRRQLTWALTEQGESLAWGFEQTRLET
jgi:hypothetical protein